METHASYLIDKYTPNHNHGIFQDLALFYISNFSNHQKSKHWANIAEKRTKEQFDYAFSSEYINKENSTAYMILGLNLFAEIIDFSSKQNFPGASELKGKYNNTLNSILYFVLPNNYISLMGDSRKAQINKLPAYYKTPNIEYLFSKGKVGTMPSDNIAYYPKSGYWIYRESWDKENFEQSTWKMFKSGYLSKTHKHADDLSFSLYSKGCEILTDTGMYNYTIGNKYRDYFLSSSAHNTITVDNKSYSTLVEESNKTGMLYYNRNNTYDYILAYNRKLIGIYIRLMTQQLYMMI